MHVIYCYYFFYCYFISDESKDLDLAFVVKITNCSKLQMRAPILCIAKLLSLTLHYNRKKLCYEPTFIFKFHFLRTAMNYLLLYSLSTIFPFARICLQLSNFSR